MRFFGSAFITEEGEYVIELQLFIIGKKQTGRWCPSSYCSNGSYYVPKMTNYVIPICVEC